VCGNLVPFGIQEYSDVPRNLIFAPCGGTDVLASLNAYYAAMAKTDYLSHATILAA
jgi:hypothetical protein